jgi:hypothetical protein
VTDDLTRARLRRVARAAAVDHHPSTQTAPETTTTSAVCTCGLTHLGLVAPPGTTATATCTACETLLVLITGAAP